MLVDSSGLVMGTLCHHLHESAIAPYFLALPFWGNLCGPLFAAEIRKQRIARRGGSNRRWRHDVPRAIRLANYVRNRSRDTPVVSNR